MEITKKIFWTEAMKGGTVMGLVEAALQLTRVSLALGGWMSILSLVLFILLTYGFTRRIAGMADAREGFSYGRCMGFVLAMMLFTGVIFGFASALINNFLIKEAVTEAIDLQMATMQDLLPQAQFDMVYDALYSAMFNPLVLVICYVIGYFIQGGIIGLFTSAMAQRQPDPLAGNDDRDDNGTDHE